MITLIAVSASFAIGVDFAGFATTLVAIGQTPKFQAFNVLGVVVTLLSGLLAVYGFYWFVIYTIYNPVYNRLPGWLYLNFRFFNPRWGEFGQHYRLVYFFHQGLLLAKIVIERYSEALQKSNYGVQIVLVDAVRHALAHAIDQCYPSSDDLTEKLHNALIELLSGVSGTIELSDVYRIQLWLLITAGYTPTRSQFDSAYKYLTLKHAYATTVHGGECTPAEFLEIKRALKILLPQELVNQIPFVQNGLGPAQLYAKVYTLLEETHDHSD